MNGGALTITGVFCWVTGLSNWATFPNFLMSLSVIREAQGAGCILLRNDSARRYFLVNFTQKFSVFFLTIEE